MAFSYAAGTEAGLFEGCVTVVYPDGKVRMLSSQLEETSARRSKAEVTVFQGADKISLMNDAFGHAGRIGINGHGLTYANLMDIKKAAPNAEIIDVSSAIAASRLVKDRDEIERLRKACQIASQVGEELPSIVKEGMPEYEAAAEIGYRMMRLGASSTSFTTNASWGPNSAEPHHEPDDSKLKKGDMVIFDLEATGNYVAVRPSGTEPKVKIYLFAYDPPAASADLPATKAAQAQRLKTIGTDFRAFSGA